MAVNQPIIQQKLYRKIRLVNRDVYALVCQQRKQLIFRDKNLTERGFFDLMEKCAKSCSKV